MGSAKTGGKLPHSASARTRSKTASNTPSSAAAASSAKNLTLSSLPPDLIIKIFSFLPVPDLPNVASCSRRLKILVYNDDVYEHKLRVMGLLNEAGVMEGVDEAEVAAVNKLSSKLKQLPGGNLLPGGTKYLESGTLWDGLS
ncbi:hypothetical protein HDU67_002711, partial [Dinochytrium kinnereticum]